MKKEYTITLDVAVFANSKEAAIRKLGQHLANGKFQYWLGDVTEEKKGVYKCIKNVRIAEKVITQY